MVAASRGAQPALPHAQPRPARRGLPESWAVARRVGELVAGREAALPSLTPAQGQGAEEQQQQQQQQLDSNPALQAALGANRARRAAAAAKSAQGGCALIVDYGAEQAFSASFRAFKAHALVDPLSEPGKADLTANVDFAHLKHALASVPDANAHGPMPQAHFLAALGLEQRVEALVRAAPDEARKDAIRKAAMRLVDMTGMGREYMMLGVEAQPSTEQEQEQQVSGESAPKVEDSAPLYPFQLQQC